jgi:two-component system chemotaxis response regulator CheY
MRSTILVVEDNDICREGLAIVLRHEGYEVIAVRDGQEALNVLRAGPAPELILLDMLMPVLDGWSFLQEMAQYPPIPIIITTGTILTPEWAACHGCFGFLRKPIETDDLLAEVKRCLA